MKPWYRAHRFQPDGLPDARGRGVEDAGGVASRVQPLLSNWNMGKLCWVKCVHHQFVGALLQELSHIKGKPVIPAAQNLTITLSSLHQPHQSLSIKTWRHMPHALTGALDAPEAAEEDVTLAKQLKIDVASPSFMGAQLVAVEVDSCCMVHCIKVQQRVMPLAAPSTGQGECPAVLHLDVVHVMIGNTCTSVR